MCPDYVVQVQGRVTDYVSISWPALARDGQKDSIRLVDRGPSKNPKASAEQVHVHPWQEQLVEPVLDFAGNGPELSQSVSVSGSSNVILMIRVAQPHETFCSQQSTSVCPCESRRHGTRLGSRWSAVWIRAAELTVITCGESPHPQAATSPVALSFARPCNTLLLELKAPIFKVTPISRVGLSVVFVDSRFLCGAVR